MEWPQILAFDIETYPDTKLVETTHGVGLTAFREDLRRRTGSDFLPPIYHIPIAIAFLKTDASFRDISVEVHTGVLDDERSLLEMFWRHCREVLEAKGSSDRRGLLVSFNGTDFDIPVLEVRALKYALSANPLVRDPACHFDVPLFLANYQPARKRGLHLATLAKLIGLPGKAMLDGSQVQSRFEMGSLNEIGKYCLLDVLQTYFLFLRCQLLNGMDPGDYENAVRSLAAFLSTSDDPNVEGAFVYLENALRTTLAVESAR